VHWTEIESLCTKTMYPLNVSLLVTFNIKLSLSKKYSYSVYSSFFRKTKGQRPRYWCIGPFLVRAWAVVTSLDEEAHAPTEVH
jgi:hypothetical protein